MWQRDRLQNGTTSQNQTERQTRRPSRDFSQHMQTLTNPGLLRRWFRHTFPVPTRFFDGQTRTTRRSVYRLFNLWLKSQGSTDEAWAAYDAYRGGDVVDIGASYGFFSLLLAPKSRAGTRHLCLEPEKRDFPRLLEHLGEAKRLFPEVDFIALPQAAGSGKESPVGTATGWRNLPTVTVDALVEVFRLEPEFVKIDVEGGEWWVLQSMEQTLRRFAPDILLEIHPPKIPVSVEHIQGWLSDLGYVATDIDVAKASIRQIWRKKV